MSLPIVTAVTDAAAEANLVAALGRSDRGITVVRRCVDVADLLAVAGSGTTRAVVLSADLRRLDHDVLARLAAARVAVVGFVNPAERWHEQTLSQLGVRYVLSTDADPDTVVEMLQAADASMATGSWNGVADPAAALPVFAAAPAQSTPAPGLGTVVAVWGPTGAPGRTTVAVGVADEAARLGVPTLLVDCDPYGGVIGQVLGMVDESPGLAAAARLHNQGRLGVGDLAGLARSLSPTLRVLTGLARSDRWPELRFESVLGVLECARTLAALTIVDCGFCLEADEEISFDTAAPRRNGATLAALDAADVVVAVGAGDPVGVQRLVRGLSDLAEAAPGSEPVVVVNKIRPTVVSGNPEHEIATALHRFAGVSRIRALPYDRDGLDRALSHGQTLAESVPRSPLRRALIEIARELTSAIARPEDLARV
ncbi:AAA family ATPase [Fodinicola feengrottensis]|uniref:P-loop NTPase n=1 Tax=Fodinicola feengrottensis TaxID=435914 RepID=A0ABN2HF09_9ACTN|nr:chromosome partitioning protein [Fodinicola feengrottensis]